MSRFSQGKTEFHQLILPSGETVDLHTASKNGKWVLSSQGWGLPPVSWQTTQHPYQHGATVRDFRLEPRTIQLLTYQSFCGRDGFWAGREDLTDAIKPNQTPISYTDYWLQRSQSDVAGNGNEITALCEWNGHLYGLTLDAHLLIWDDVGAWQIAAEPPTNATVHMEHGYGLCSGAMELYDSGINGDPIYYYDPPASGLALVYTTVWQAQTFTMEYDYEVTGARIYLNDLSGTVGTVTGSIRATDGAGLPTGADLASGSFVTGGFAPPGWLTVTFTTPVVLSFGTKYALVVRDSGASVGDADDWSYKSTGAFANGNQAESTDSGATWTAPTPAYDLFFEILGHQPYRSQDLLWAIGEGDDGGTASLVWAFDGDWSDDHWAYHTDDEKAYCGIILDGELIIGTSNDGILRQYPRLDENNILDAVGDTLPSEEDIRCLAYHGTHLYLGTGNNAELWEWDGTVTTTEVAPQAGGDQTTIYDLAVYQGKLYGISDHGKLWQWNDVNAWVNVAGELDAAGAHRHALEVYNGRLYGSGYDGALYVWNNSNAWVSVCTAITIDGANQQIQTMATYRNRLFAGTYDATALIERIHDAAYDEPQPLVLRRFLSNGEKRDLEVFIGEGPQFDDMPGGWREHSFQELLRFVAYNPVLYDPDTVTITYTMGVGMISEAQNVDYTGTWEEHPTITIAGPLHELTIINETIGEYIKLDYDIPDAVTVTIDCQKLTIEDSLHNNLLSALTPESSFATFRFEPHPVIPAATGRNVIRVIGHGSDAGTTLHIDYKRRFIGI